jgi:NADH-quinone oxidoreductase subunit H
MYSTLAERRVAAWLQDRSGLIEAGKEGLLQPLCRRFKIIFENSERIHPTDSYSSLDQQCSNEYCTHDKRCNSLGDRFIFWKRHYTASNRYRCSITIRFGVISVGVYGIDWWMGFK